MNEDTLGNSEAARRLAMMYDEGKITAGQWRKLGRAYTHFCFVMNEIWMSGIEERTKRNLDHLAYVNAIQKTHLMELSHPLDSYLRNILSTYHKEISSKFKTQRVIKRGVGNRVYRTTT